jgi:hypothetical protein
LKEEKLTMTRDKCREYVNNWKEENDTLSCNVYHGNLDVCTVNKVRKYHSMCKMADSVYLAVETQQRIFH